MLDERTINEIIKLRKDGVSTRVIAKELGISLSSVRYHSKKNGLGGVIAENSLVDDAFERFVNGFNKRHGDRFTYISGFVNSEKAVLVRCKVCSDEFYRGAHVARKDKKLTCTTCKVLEKRESEVKRLRERILRNAVRPTSALREVNIGKCIECDQLFSKSNKGYCSEKCKRKKNNRLKELSRRTRLKRNGKVDYSITLLKLIRKENNTCYICGGQCDSEDFSHDKDGNFVVGRSYPSIEHVIPVSKGGTHTWDNVKLAHHYCNSLKSDRDTADNTGQLVLIL